VDSALTKYSSADDCRLEAYHNKKNRTLAQLKKCETQIKSNTENKDSLKLLSESRHCVTDQKIPQDAVKGALMVRSLDCNKTKTTEQDMQLIHRAHSPPSWCQGVEIAMMSRKLLTNS